MTPGVSPLLLTPSVNTKIHRVPTHSIGASPLLLTPSVNTKIHRVPTHSTGASPLLLTPSVNTKIHRVPTHSIGASPLLLTPSVNTKIHRVPTHSTGASPLSLTPSVNTKIHCVPPHSNLHGRRLLEYYESFSGHIIRPFQLLVTRDILYGRAPLSPLTAMASQGLTSSSWDAGKATPWTSTLMNAKSLTISGKSSVSTPSFSPLFTNLSGIVDGHANSLGLLVLLHAPAAWPVETCREASLNHKAAAIHQSIFHMITILSSSNGNWLNIYGVVGYKINRLPFVDETVVRRP